MIPSDFALPSSPRGPRVYAGPLHTAIQSIPALLLGWTLLGCGHAATEEECKLIVDRNVELQLRGMNIVDPEAIRKKQEEIRAKLGNELSGCIGRRVTNGTMDCVKQAATKEAVQACFR